MIGICCAAWPDDAAAVLAADLQTRMMMLNVMNDAWCTQAVQMGPVAIDRRASSSLAELIASMSEDELGTAVPEAAPQLQPASLPAVGDGIAVPPAGDLTAESPPTPDAAAYGFSRGSTARR